MILFLSLATLMVAMFMQSAIGWNSSGNEVFRSKSWKMARLCLITLDILLVKLVIYIFEKQLWAYGAFCRHEVWRDKLSIFPRYRFYLQFVCMALVIILNVFYLWTAASCWFFPFCEVIYKHKYWDTLTKNLMNGPSGIIFALCVLQWTPFFSHWTEIVFLC